MIPWLLAAGAGLLLGAGAVYIYHHWDEILNWLRGFLPRVANAIREIGRRLGPRTQYATEAVAKILDGATAAIEHHLYVKEAQGWTDTITTAKVPVSELPPRVRRKVRRIGDENDVTDEMEMEVGMSI